MTEAEFEEKWAAARPVVEGTLRRQWPRLGWEDLEDLVATTALLAWRARHRFDDTGKHSPILAFTAWVLMIAKNAARDEYRRRSNRPFVASLPEGVGDRLPKYEFGYEDVETTELLEQILVFLSPVHREIVTLTVNGLPQVAIAAKLGIPKETVRSRLNRARERVWGLVRDGGADWAEALPRVVTV